MSLKIKGIIQNHKSEKQTKEAERQAAEKERAEAARLFKRNASDHLETVITPVLINLVKDLRSAGYLAIQGRESVSYVGVKTRSIPKPATDAYNALSTKIEGVALQFFIVANRGSNSFDLEISTTTPYKCQVSLSLAEATAEKVEQILLTAIEGMLQKSIA